MATYYTLRMRDILEIRDNSGDWFRSIDDAFRFGYLQGTKAAKAEMKRKGKVA